MRSTPYICSLLLLGAIVAACHHDSEAGPPEILYGQDICEACRMVISERRHAAGARLGGPELRFDDPGCLVAFEGTGETGSRRRAWVHDENEEWRLVDEAWFVLDPARGTPMASGIMAFSSEQAAVSTAKRAEARSVRWSELAVEMAPSVD